MADGDGSRARYGEAFWRAHHEAWRRSELNQREYCEAQGIPLKAFGNWRVKFEAEPQPPARKLLYRRGGLSHTLSHSLSHMTYDPGPVVPPAREGYRRRFSEADKRRIVRKNHLFAGSDGGGERWATVCSLITTAKLNDIEPYGYLKGVLERMVQGHPSSQLDDLLPWNWARSQAGH